MSRFLKNRISSMGKAPGSIIFIGTQKVEQVQMEMFHFTESELRETQPTAVSELEVPPNSTGIRWININGLHDDAIITEIGKLFNFSPLALEAVVNTDSRPRIEEFEDHLLISLKMLKYDQEAKIIRSEHFSLIFRENLVITFQEEPGDVFQLVRERLRHSRGRIRKAGSDYLAYALVDLIFDHYIFAVENFGTAIEDLEEQILTDANPDLLEDINNFKREINFLRKNIRPARELAIVFQKIESPIVRKATYPFLRELNPSVTQAIEVVDTYGNLLSDFLQIYHTSVSNRMNEIMKVLTIFSAVFIPLTFIAGIYGTNFDYIPETKWKYSYFVFWVVLLITGFLMLRYFRKKKWL